jgi:serine/threonine-protein kinase
VQSAQDVKLQLMWLAEGATSASGIAVQSLPTTRRPQWIAYGLVALAAASAMALVMALLPRDRAPAPTTAQRFIIGSADLQIQSAPALSPDGATIVFSVREENAPRLFRRALSSFESTPIPGTEGGQAPFFSPDGSWIGFATESAIKKVPVGGGAAQTICNEPLVDSADWGPDGMIYFTPRLGGTKGNTLLARVPATGGKVEVVAVCDSTAGEGESWCPEILPGSGTILVTATNGPDWYIVALGANGSRHRVVSKALFSRYSPSGHLLWCDFESQAVLAAPFDPVKAEITGPAVPVTEPVDFNLAYDLGASGALVYVPANSGLGDELVWLERDGKSSLACETRARWRQPRISPDGKRIVVRKQATNCELWTLDVDRGSLGRIAQDADNHDPVWSPDGRRIVYERVGSHMVLALAMDGSRGRRAGARLRPRDVARGPGGHDRGHQHDGRDGGRESLPTHDGHASQARRPRSSGRRSRSGDRGPRPRLGRS